MSEKPPKLEKWQCKDQELVKSFEMAVHEAYNVLGQPAALTNSAALGASPPIRWVVVDREEKNKHSRLMFVDLGDQKRLSINHKIPPIEEGEEIEWAVTLFDSGESQERITTHVELTKSGEAFVSSHMYSHAYDVNEAPEELPVSDSTLAQVAEVLHYAAVHLPAEQSKFVEAYANKSPQ